MTRTGKCDRCGMRRVLAVCGDVVTGAEYRLCWACQCGRPSALPSCASVAAPVTGTVAPGGVDFSDPALWAAPAMGERDALSALVAAGAVGVMEVTVTVCLPCGCAAGSGCDSPGDTA